MVNVSTYGSKPADKMKREINIRYPQSPYAVYSLMLGVYRSMRINNLHFPAYRQLDQLIHLITNDMSAAKLELPNEIIKDFRSWWHGDSNDNTPSGIPAGKYLAPGKTVHEQMITVSIRKPVSVTFAWADYIHNNDWSYVGRILNIDSDRDCDLRDLATKDIPIAVWNQWVLEVMDALDGPCILIESFVSSAIFQKAGLITSSASAYEANDDEEGVNADTDPYSNLRP